MPGPGAVIARLRDRSRALAAMSAQFSQAAGSLVVGVLSARLMSQLDFATVALILGQIVVATGISTGLVGDTLTVLDRHDPRIRTALTRVLGALLVAAAGLAAGSSLLTRQLGLGPAALFGVLLAAWLAEDVVRRLLMATLRFWSIVAVDLTHLVVCTGTVVVTYLADGRHATVGLFLVALTAGQVTAGLVGIALLPTAERSRGAREGGGLRTVLDFGVSRAVQGSLRPAVLMVLRIVVIFVAGKAVYATVEAARIYVAPALLAVNGMGSFLLSTFASSKGPLPRSALRRADLTTLALLGCSVVLTAASWALADLDPTLLSHRVTVLPLAVAAWGLYTGCVAVTMPYGSLAAVRGRQHAVLLVRLGDSAVSLLLVTVPLWMHWVPVQAAPALVGAGAASASLLLRPLASQALSPRSRHVDTVEGGRLTSRPPARRVRDQRSRPRATAWLDADVGPPDRFAAPTGSLARLGTADTAPTGHPGHSAVPAPPVLGSVVPVGWGAPGEPAVPSP